MAATEAQQKRFIEIIAPFIVKYAAQYGVLTPSAVIAQACHETGYGVGAGALKKVDHYNFFGLKYREGRVDCHVGFFNDTSKEEYVKGVYTPISTDWYAFDSVEMGCLGYFEFLFKHTNMYSEALGLADPEAYLRAIWKVGYATGKEYVEHVLPIISKHNLTIYDNIAATADKSSKKLVINVHAGHNPDGMRACGAVGYLKESTQNRAVAQALIEKLRAKGHTVYDCTCNNGTSVNDVLEKIVAKCNAHTVDLDISIHFNAGSSDPNDDTTGTEVWLYDQTSTSKPYAEAIVNEIAALGFKNRGVKYRDTLYFLRNTKAPALLIEVCFVDDKDDAKWYLSLGPEAIADAIVKGITGEAPDEIVRDPEPTVTEPVQGSTDESDPEGYWLYHVQVGEYKVPGNAERKAAEMAALGIRTKTYKEWITPGKNSTWVGV